MGEKLTFPGGASGRTDDPGSMGKAVGLFAGFVFIVVSVIAVVAGLAIRAGGTVRQTIGLPSATEAVDDDGGSGGGPAL